MLFLACMLYSVYICGTVLGIQQVVSGLQNYRFHELIIGCVLLWISEYMTGELGPVMVEFYNKL